MTIHPAGHAQPGEFTISPASTNRVFRFTSAAAR
jgi:hypothetical protein